jgi:acyl carrier protein
MRAKVEGTLVVESLLDDGAFLALMSSVDAWNPGPGQTAYAAANTFLDAFAVHRRSLGKPVVSINWDRWLGVGMAERFARSAGVPLSHGLTPEQGYDAFRAAMQTANPNVLVSKGTWQVRPRPAAAPATSAAVASGDASHVSKKIREVWKSLFGVDDVDANQNFFELGATSLDIVQLTARIRASLACEIAPTVLYNHPNINALAHHLAEPAAGMAPVEETVRRPRNLLTQRARAGTRS